MQTIGKCCRGCVISRYCIRRILATITDISYLYCCTDVELFAGFQLIFERMDIWQGSAGSFIALASVSQRLRNTSHGFSGFSHRVWSVLWFHTTSCRITYHPDQWQSQPVLADTLAQWDKCFLRVHGLAIVSVKFELAFGAPGYKPCISSFQLTQSLFAWMTLHKWKSRWLCKMGLVIGIPALSLAYQCFYRWQGRFVS